MCACSAWSPRLTGFLFEKHTLRHNKHVPFEDLKDTPPVTYKTGYPVWTLKLSQIFKHCKEHTRKVVEAVYYPVASLIFPFHRFVSIAVKFCSSSRGPKWVKHKWTVGIYFISQLKFWNTGILDQGVEEDTVTRKMMKLFQGILNSWKLKSMFTTPVCLRERESRLPYICYWVCGTATVSVKTTVHNCLGSFISTSFLMVPERV